MHIEWRMPPTLVQPLLGVGALVVLGGAAWWWMSAPVQESTVSRIVRQQPTASGIATATDTVIVDVIGSVRRPGVVRLPAGARVIDAVAAAGGLLPHRAPIVNMARAVVDGEQIVIGAGAAQPRDAVGPSATAGRIDINTSSAAQLDALPGIGPVLAERIVEYRREHGRFAHVRDLLDVPGIGDAKFAELADAVSVS